MSNRIKLKGTSESIFEIGLKKGVLDFSNLTIQRSLIFPDSNGYLGLALTTDGFGNLKWDSNQCPTFVSSSETYVIQSNKQVLYALAIDSEGTLEVNGALIAM